MTYVAIFRLLPTNWYQILVQTKLITTTQKPIYTTKQSEEIPENQDCRAEVTRNQHCGIVESALAFTESEEATCLNKTLQKTPCLSPIIAGMVNVHIIWPILYGSIFLDISKFMLDKSFIAMHR